MQDRLDPAGAPRGEPGAGVRDHHGPLSGYRVVDLTTNLSGPLTTMVLADQGADVVKVEKPPRGDIVRSVGTGAGGMSAYFASANRNKRSVAIDYTLPAGRDLVARLAGTADVVVQNFRPGVVEALGLDAETLRREHPELVYASISGFGHEGPLSDQPAYDHVIQALSGIAAVQTDPRSGEPALVRQAVVDKVTAYVLAQAITAALLARERSGRGQHVRISMLDAAIAFLWPDGMMNHTCLDDVEVLPPVANSFRVTKTADGAIAMVVLTDEQWQGLVRAAGMEAVLSDPKFSTMAGRTRHGGAVMRECAAVIGRLSTAEAIERLRAADVPCAPVLELAEVPSHPQVRANGSVVEVRHPRLGRILQPLPAARLEGLAGPVDRPAPDLGQDTDAVLAEVGLDAEEVRRLRAARVIA